MEFICSQCPVKITKPGNEPAAYREDVLSALELDEYRECGATFEFPDGLTEREWSALKALRRGRGKAEYKRFQKLRDEQKMARERAKNPRR